ncbi:hypothetical protein IWX90DRAFT_389638 [Phyllosticta citrichinensis]|uniref:Peroxisomal membrane protein PEX17 n=1 Tax=Phyllosticta citrichinensis TaxID=1130410 RepID=A0ABR1XKA8_9PEZI
MPADRLLETLLRSLQIWTDQQDTPRLLATAASLLTTLTNPLNIQLLTGQLLFAPAIWERPDGLRTCQRFMSLFHSATFTFLKHDRDVREGIAKPPLPGQIPIGGGMIPEEWARAVAKGADERSPRWKHILILAGLLLGSNQEEDCTFSKSLQSSLQRAFVEATNVALEEAREDDFGGQCIAMVLNHVFPVLSETERAQLDYDHLLPVLIGSAFFSNEGFHSAYFLGTIDLDVVEVSGQKLGWSARSTSYHQLQRIMSRPLMTYMGPFSRLVAHTVENVQNSGLIQTMIDDIAGFARTLNLQWRQNKLSEIDQSEEAAHLSQETVKSTLPLLWKTLKSALFAIVIILRGALGRILGDGTLAADGVAPILVTHSLHTLRNLYFISSRLGANSLSQYTFSYLTSLDILSKYPMQADALLKAIRPATLGQIPRHPLDRIHDLYFLNTAEHFAPILSPQTAEELLVTASTPYLGAGGSRHLLPIFEAAHSVMLSVFSSRTSGPALAGRHLPFYVSSLFAAFPANLSPRQFRLAFKTLMQVTTPPSPLSSSQPDLPATLCELVHHRALSAPATPLPTAVAPSPPPPGAETLPPGEHALSEQAVLALTLLDALPLLPVPLLEEWLPLCADLVNAIADEPLRDVVRRRFWEVLVGGEMDPERSLVAVAWWTTRGGRERVLFGDGGEEAMAERFEMSGALGPARVMSGVEEGRARESKL